MNILVADGSPALSTRICGIISAMGHTSAQVAGLIDALNLTRENRFDGALIDLNLKSKFNGIGVMDELMRNSPGIRICFMTDMLVDDHLVGVLTSIGAVTVIAKPFTSERLESILRDWDYQVTQIRTLPA